MNIIETHRLISDVNHARQSDGHILRIVPLYEFFQRIRKCMKCFYVFDDNFCHRFCSSAYVTGGINGKRTFQDNCSFCEHTVEQDKQCTCNVTLMRVRAAIVAVGKQ